MFLERRAPDIRYPLVFFAVVFIILSFVPQPVQELWSVAVRLIAGIFLAIILIAGAGRRALVGLSDWPAWFFLVTLAAGLWNAIDRTEAIRFYGYLSSTFVIMFYIGKSVYRQHDAQRAVAWIVVGCALCVSGIGYAELFFGKNILYEFLVENPYYARYVTVLTPRAVSTQGNPTVLGTYLLGCLPFCLLIADQKARISRFIGYAAAVVLGTLLVLTFSRGVLLGLLAMGAAYCVVQKRIKILIIFLAVVAMLIAVFSFMPSGSNLSRFGFQGLIAGGQDSIVSDYRLQRLTTAWRMFKQHPAFGVGFNHYKLRFDAYCPEADPHELLEFKTPDNMFAALLAETGVIGLAGFLVLSGVLFARGLRRLNRDPKGRGSFALWAAFTGLLVNMGAYELLYWNNPYMFFCLLCGFVQGAEEPRYP